MATTLFDRPLFVQRKHYVDEIASLEDAFDMLEPGRPTSAGFHMKSL